MLFKWVMVMSHEFEPVRRTGRSGFPSEVSKDQYLAALERARAYLRSARELRDRAEFSEEIATARLLASERTLRIARQVLARLQMLGRRFDTN